MNLIQLSQVQPAARPAPLSTGLAVLDAPALGPPSGLTLVGGSAHRRYKIALARQLAGAGAQAGADLKHADLRDGHLAGVLGVSHSPDFAAEVLRQGAQGDLQKMMVAGLPLVTRGLCLQGDNGNGLTWEGMAAELPQELAEWALKTLSADPAWGFRGKLQENSTLLDGIQGV